MKIESKVTIFIIYDLETHETDRARPHFITFFRISILAGKSNRGLTPYEIQNRDFCI